MRCFFGNTSLISFAHLRFYPVAVADPSTRRYRQKTAETVGSQRNSMTALTAEILVLGAPLPESKTAETTVFRRPKIEGNDENRRKTAETTGSRCVRGARDRQRKRWGRTSAKLRATTPSEFEKNSRVANRENRAGEKKIEAGKTRGLKQGEVGYRPRSPNSATKDGYWSCSTSRIRESHSEQLTATTSIVRQQDSTVSCSIAMSPPQSGQASRKIRRPLSTRL